MVSAREGHSLSHLPPAAPQAPTQRFLLSPPVVSDTQASTSARTCTQAHPAQSQLPSLHLAPLSLQRNPPAVGGGAGASPSGRATLILSTASRFWMSLCMLWATPGYWEGGSRECHSSGTAVCHPHPSWPPLSPGSSQPPGSHPSACPGALVRWRQRQRAPPPKTLPWPASLRRAPLQELSGERGPKNHHHH